MNVQMANAHRMLAFQQQDKDVSFILQGVTS